MVGDRAQGLADGLGALIDGVYLREALKPGVPDAGAAIAQVRAYLAAEVAG
jgi:TetR/AcrR family transcriptional regulator, transcriptional repressor of bet genes